MQVLKPSDKALAPADGMAAVHAIRGMMVIARVEPKVTLALQLTHRVRVVYVHIVVLPIRRLLHKGLHDLHAKQCHFEQVSYKGLCGVQMTDQLTASTMLLAHCQAGHGADKRPVGEVLLLSMLICNVCCILRWRLHLAEAEHLLPEACHTNA